MAETASLPGLTLLPFTDSVPREEYPVIRLSERGDGGDSAEDPAAVIPADFPFTSEKERLPAVEPVPAEAVVPESRSAPFDRELALAGLQGIEHELVRFASRYLSHPMRVNARFVIHGGENAAGILERSRFLLRALSEGITPSREAVTACLKLYYAFSREKEALELIRRFPDRTPEMHYLAGLFEYRLQDNDAAERFGREALNGYQPEAPVRYLIAAARSRSGDAAGALEEADRAFSFFSTDRPFLDFIYRTAVTAGNGAVGLKALAALHALSPDDIGILASYADALYEAGYLGKAAPLYAVLDGAGRIRDRQRIRYALALAATGDAGEAESVITTWGKGRITGPLHELLPGLLECGERDPNIYALIAGRHLGNGDMESFLSVLKSAAVEGITGGRLRLLEAEAALLRKEAETALALLGEPGWEEALLPERDFFTGLARYLSGDHGEAESRFQSVTADSPRYGAASFYLGEIAFGREEYRTAVRCFRIALKYKVHERKALIRLADAAMKAKLLLMAEEAFREVLRIDPDHIDAYNNLGILYARQDRLEDAVNILKEGLRRAPEDRDLHYNLSLVYERVIRKESREHYGRFVELQPAPDGEREGL